MAKQILFFSFLVSSCSWGMEEISQNKEIRYTKGQGLEFDFPLHDHDKQRNIAHQIVDSLHEQGLTTYDVFSDHLENKQKVFENRLSTVCELYNKEFKPIKDELDSNFVELKKNNYIRGGEVKFKDKFSDQTEKLIRLVFKNSGVNSRIIVKKSESLNALASIRTTMSKIGHKFVMHLYLLSSTWANENKFVENNYFMAKSILLHEAVHARELHGVYQLLTRRLLNKNGIHLCAQETVMNFLDESYEHRADLLPFIEGNNSARVSFRRDIRYRNASSIPSQYLSIKERLKIITLYDAEECVENEKRHAKRKLDEAFSLRKKICKKKELPGLLEECRKQPTNKPSDWI